MQKIATGLSWAVLFFRLCSVAHGATADLESGWSAPPEEARLRAYWWWLNGDVTVASITRDLEEMKDKGFGGAVIFDAGGASQDGNGPVPHGPTFFSPPWRELYKHTLREADRLGLEISLNIQSGWNLGGPMVKPEDAAKRLVWSETRARGGADGATKTSIVLPEPRHQDPFYRDLYVIAWPMKGNSASPEGAKPTPSRIHNFDLKAVYKSLGGSAPDSSGLLEELASSPGEEDARQGQVVDLSDHVKDGVLNWDVPAGQWEIVRFGFTVGGSARVSTNSDGWSGYALDVLDRDAFRRYWDAVVEPLIEDAGPLAGRSLKYLHTDSWEIEAYNWAPTLPAEFKARRGYDMLPFLPVLAGRIVDNRDVSNRFLFDFRRTLGDLAIEHHYKPFREWAARHHLEIHPESGGPHGVPIDAQECLGQDQVPMSEFWAWSFTHRIGDVNRFFVKQPASAAHAYGHPLVAAEGFTDIGLHWQERIWENLKPSFDQACCEGLNRLVWHAFVCSPDENEVPGIQYFAGTHFNPKVTWWSRSRPFLTYLNRCQWMLQQGRFVADAVYYYGDNVPSFAQLRASDPARVGPGRDYDVIPADALLNRTQVRDGRIVLPDAMSYRVLVLPDRQAISLPVLRKVKALVEQGATVIGPRPIRATGLTDFPAADAEVGQIADAMWGPAGTENKASRTFGKGRVVPPIAADKLLQAGGIPPDFESVGGRKDSEIHYIHRVDGDTDIYFVSNRLPRPEHVTCTLRVSGKAPELWDAVSGNRALATRWAQVNGRIELPLDLNPCGSIFVVFRQPSADHPATGVANFPTFAARQELTGPWTVAFDAKFGGPASATFDRLQSWTERPEAGIRFYSGTATYRQRFELPADLSGGPHHLWLNLGDVRELAEVRLNGKSLGITWAPPFRVDLGDAVKPGGNSLEIDVVNFWANRVIGDQSLPTDKRITSTNVRKLTSKTPLMESGLLGPVQIEEQQP